MSMKALRGRLERATASNASAITEGEMQAFRRFKAAKKVQFPDILFPEMRVEDAQALLEADPVRSEDFETVQRAYGKVRGAVVIERTAIARKARLAISR